MLKPKNNSCHFSSLFSILVIISISLWYFTDFKITKWGNITLTTSNFLESYYWTKRDIFWQKNLDRIHNTDNQDLKTLLLEKYIQLIPVDQWWSPLRKYKVNALCSVLETHQQHQNWPTLEKYSQEFIKINPNFANGWYYLGLSLEKQDNTDQAVKNYQQALLREITHLNSIKRLSSILLAKGKYNQANKLLIPYKQIIQTTDPELNKIQQKINEKNF